MDTQLKIFNSDIEELLIKSQFNMKKLTMNNVQLSDLVKSSLNENIQIQQESIGQINDQIKQCVQMQDEFLKLEALQKKVQIFRLLIEDAVNKKEQEYNQIQKEKQEQIQK